MAATAKNDTEVVKTGLATLARLGALASLVLLGVVFAWMWFTQISSAVIAPGQVVVHGLAKEVQSLDGGVIERIYVSDGDVVHKGDVLLRLDPSLIRINLDLYRNRLAEVSAREARLESEYQGLGAPVFDIDKTYLKGIDLTRHIAGQREVFRARLEVLNGRKAQLRERIAQYQNQISGVEAVIAAKNEQLAFVARELENVSGLNSQGLARESDMLTLQRNKAALLGDVAKAQSDLAQIRNSIRDTQLEMVQADNKFKEQVVNDLRDTTTKREDLVLQIVTARKQLERVDIVAPTDGVVHQMRVTTEGGVLAPEATIAEIVPLSKGVDFRLEVDPRSIDQVFVGQRARVVFPAFNMRTTPELYGSVSGISPSTVQDKKTGRSYFQIELSLSEDELALLGDQKLIPGMPVEAFLQTGKHSVLSYLTEPILRQIDLAFRDT